MIYVAGAIGRSLAASGLFKKQLSTTEADLLFLKNIRSSVVLSELTYKMAHFLRFEAKDELDNGKKIDRRVPRVPFAIEITF